MNNWKKLKEEYPAEKRMLLLYKVPDDLDYNDILDLDYDDVLQDLLMEKNTRVGGKVYPYAIDKRQAVDIDDEFAFWLVEDMIKQNKFEFLK